jgi:hypothetical protein
MTVNAIQRPKLALGGTGKTAPRHFAQFARNAAASGAWNVPQEAEA